MSYLKITFSENSTKQNLNYHNSTSWKKSIKPDERTHVTLNIKEKKYIHLMVFILSFRLIISLFCFHSIMSSQNSEMR